MTQEEEKTESKNGFDEGPIFVKFKNIYVKGLFSLNYVATQSSFAEPNLL